MNGQASKTGAAALALIGLGLCGGLAGCAGAGSGPEVGPVPLAYPAKRQVWRFGGVTGWKLTTEHYVVFTTTTSHSLRNSIAGFVEAARANYVHLTALDVPAAGPRKLPVYLFGSRGQWATLTREVTGTAAETYLRVQGGGYCYAGVCVYWDIGALPTYSVAAHEGMHQFFHYATRQALPVWAEEGLAVQAEGYRIRDGLVYFRPERNTLRMSTLRKTILAGRWRSAGELVAMSAADNIRQSGLHGAEYYGQLWALLLLLRGDERYAAGLQRLLRDAADGRLNEALGIGPRAWASLQRSARAYAAAVGPKAFAHYIDADTERFEQRYHAFARKLVRLK